MDAFNDFDFKAQISRNPKCCQSAESTVLGYLYPSHKNMNEKTFGEATRKALGIPDTVAIGFQYRAIINRDGRRPKWNKESPAPAALHIEIDSRFATLYQHKAATLWSKCRSKDKRGLRRYPNGVVLRLIPCFSNAAIRSLPTHDQEDILQFSYKQQCFVAEHLVTLDFAFIANLDLPLSTQEPMTLRRFIMSQAPEAAPTARLFHNVDRGWNSTTKTTFATATVYQQEARAWIDAMIPYATHQYGDLVKKWFTPQGMEVFSNIRYDPTKRTTNLTSTNFKESLAENLWGMGDSWKPTIPRPDAENLNPTNTTSTPTNPTPPSQNATQANTTNPTGTEGSTQAMDVDANDKSITNNFASGQSVASLGRFFGKETEAETVESVPLEGAIQFDPSTIDQNKTIDLSQQDEYSMSTMGKTTDSTRLKLVNAKDHIQDQATQIEALRAQLALLNQANPPQTPPKRKDKYDTNDVDEMLSDQDDDKGEENDEMTL